jgi:hypothetical protein
VGSCGSIKRGGGISWLDERSFRSSKWKYFKIRLLFSGNEYDQGNIYVHKFSYWTFFAHERGTVRTVTCIPIARQRLGKHIPARANARDNRASIARQRRGNQTPRASYRLCFLRGPCKVVIRSVRQYRSTMEQYSRVRSRASRRHPASLGAEELNWVESSELSVAE